MGSQKYKDNREYINMSQKNKNNKFISSDGHGRVNQQNLLDYTQFFALKKTCFHNCDRVCVSMCV